MKEMILTPIRFNVDKRELQMNVTVFRSENSIHISNSLKPYLNFFFGITWHEGLYKEPIPITGEILEMYDVQDKMIGLKIGSEYMKGRISNIEGEMKIITMYKNRFVVIDYLHELELIYKLLIGKDLVV